MNYWGLKLNIPVSPASPEYAMRVCLFKGRVLSSPAFRMVAPRIAALDAAMSVKSLPVIPSRTSLFHRISNFQAVWSLDLYIPYILAFRVLFCGKVVVYGGSYCFVESDL